MVIDYFLHTYQMSFCCSAALTGQYADDFIDDESDDDDDNDDDVDEEIDDSEASDESYSSAYSVEEDFDVSRVLFDKHTCTP